MISFALGIPHTPWIPERADSLAALLGALGIIDHEPDCQGVNPLADGRCATCFDVHVLRVFADREPNVAWSEKLWAWGAAECSGSANDSGATHLLQLQDDVAVPDCFWSALTAMVTAVPDKIIGLQGAHPVFRQLARDGHKWARSHAWMVGCGYVIPRADLAELVKFRAIFDGIAHEKNEDDFIAWFCTETGRDVWHPIPTLIDHTPLPSTYGNDANAYQRPTVTWREFGADEITRTDFWTPTAEVPMVVNPHLNRCWFCQQEPHVVGFRETGALIGRACLANAVAGALGVGRAS